MRHIDLPGMCCWAASYMFIVGAAVLGSRSFSTQGCQGLLALFHCVSGWQSLTEDFRCVRSGPGGPISNSAPLTRVLIAC